MSGFGASTKAISLYLRCLYVAPASLIFSSLLQAQAPSPLPGEDPIPAEVTCPARRAAPPSSSCKFLISSARSLGTETNFVAGDRYCLSQNISSGSFTFSKDGVILDGNGFSANGASIAIDATRSNITIERMLLASGSVSVHGVNNLVSSSTMGYLNVRGTRNQVISSAVTNNTGTIAFDLESGSDLVVSSSYATCNYFEANRISGVGNTATRFVHLNHTISNTFVGNTFSLDQAHMGTGDNAILFITYRSYFNELRGNRFYIHMAPTGLSGGYYGAGLRLRNSSSFNRFFDNEFRCDVKRCIIIDRGDSATSLPRDNLFAGNRVYDIETSFWIYGLLSGSSNNIFNNNLLYSQGSTALFTDWLSGAQATFTNNTFIAAGNHAYYDDTSGATKLTLKSNLFFSKTSPAFNPNNIASEIKYNALSTYSNASLTQCGTSGGTPVNSPMGCNLVGTISLARPEQVGLNPVAKDSQGEFILDRDGRSFLPSGSALQTFGEGGGAIGFRPPDSLAPNSPTNLGVSP